MEVDHDRCDRLAPELALRVVDTTDAGLLLLETFDHGHVKGKVVGQDQLERLADDGKLLADVEAVRGLQNLRQEQGTLKVLVDKTLEATIDVAVKVLGEHGVADAFHAGGKLGRVGLESPGGFVKRLDPVDVEALVVSHVDLASVDGKVEAVAVGDVDAAFHLREALDVADGETEADMALVVCLPVLHEIGNVLDVDTSARDLPETGMRGLAASTRIALVASLLEELAS